MIACSGLRQEPDCRPRRTFLHLSYSYATPFGPAILVTQDPNQTSAVRGSLSAYSRARVSFTFAFGRPADLMRAQALRYFCGWSYDAARDYSHTKNATTLTQRRSHWRAVGRGARLSE